MESREPCVEPTFAEPASSHLRRSASRRSHRWRALEAGDAIPGTQYRVVRLIGQGGMGRVYEVEHLELGKRFVLKVLRCELATRPDLVARLRNEGRALGRLQHPSIVSVTDAGTTPERIPYYVMEKLDGETLLQRLRRERRLPLTQACRIAVEVLGALGAVHDAEIVHRDVKPSNVYLARGGAVKLLDFGIAKIASAAACLTAPGVALGTPRYMSPEQARGATVDPRADLYALGLVLHEMLAGRGPFDPVRDAGRLPAGRSRPTPLSASVPNVPGAVAGLVARLLASDPAERPGSAREARAVLEPFASAPDHAGAARPGRLAPRATVWAASEFAHVRTPCATLRLPAEEIEQNSVWAAGYDKRPRGAVRRSLFWSRRVAAWSGLLAFIVVMLACVGLGISEVARRRGAAPRVERGCGGWSPSASSGGCGSMGPDSASRVGLTVSVVGVPVPTKPNFPAAAVSVRPARSSSARGP